MDSPAVVLAAIVAAALACPRPASAANLTDNDVRGGWIADVGGQRVIYVLKVRDGRISGIYCSDCANPDQVAFRAPRGRGRRAVLRDGAGPARERPARPDVHEPGRARRPCHRDVADARAAPDAKRIALAR
jgi:hypothetical protein